MLDNEVRMVNIKGIDHWVKISGAENKTVPIMVIHGGPGGHNYVFEHTVGARLELDFTVIYYEQRGSGRSASPKDDNDFHFETLLSDLEDLCNILKIDKIIPLGYSFGGEFALRFASKYPHLVDRVIAEAPSNISDIDYTAKIQLQGFIEVANKEEVIKLKSVDTRIINGKELMSYIWDNTSLETQSRFLFHNEENARRMYKFWEEAWNVLKLTNTGKMADVIFKEQNLENTLVVSKNIKCNTLIIIGKNDRNCGVELARAYKDLIPKAKLVIVPNAAHFVDFEQEEIFLKEVKNFLNS